MSIESLHRSLGYNETTNKLMDNIWKLCDNLIKMQHTDPSLERSGYKLRCTCIEKDFCMMGKTESSGT